MAKDEAYRIAERKIEKARRTEAKELDLSPKDDKSSKLTELPESLGQLIQLQRLDLTGNQLTALPESLGQLTQLQTLRLIGNQLTVLPESLGQLTQLQDLDLSFTQLMALPESLGQLTQLQMLDLSFNQLTALPESMGRLTQLQTLFLSFNQLTVLPESLGQLTQLKRLYLGGNQLTALPESLGQLTQLQALILHQIQLPVLPEWLGQLTQLNHLDLSFTHLTALPESLGQLTQLQRLVLVGNELTALPEWLGKLTRLQIMNLDGNQLTALPESIKDLRNLKQLFLHDNLALDLPVEILGPTLQEVNQRRKPADPAAILDYYFKTRTGGRPLNEVKLILVGRGGVGKTTLVNRLIRGKFCKTSRTKGIAVKPWKLKVDGSDVRLNVWDFGGQEMMHATHQFFLTERSVYLLAVSGREGNAMADAEYWLKLIQSFGGNSPVLLVRNKIRETPFDLDEEVLREKYPMLLGPSVATDCKAGVGCKEVEKRLRVAISDATEWRKPFPGSWWAIKNCLEKLPGSHLTRADFEALCTKHGEPNAIEQERLATSLKALGIIVHYWDDPRLRETAVLRPNWLTQGIYRLLNDPHLGKAKGVVRTADMVRILSESEYPKDLHGFLFQVMRKFRLCHEIPKRPGIWLLPELLPEAQPAGLGDWGEKECLALRYNYPVLPEGLVPRFIAQAFPLVYKQQQWRFGVVLELDSALARVRADRTENSVTVLLRNGMPEAHKRLLSYIRACFEEMHGEFKGLGVKTSIRQAGADTKWEDYDRLLELESADEKALSKSEYGLIDKKKVSEKLDRVETPEERMIPVWEEARSLLGKELFSSLDLSGVPLFVSYAHEDRELKSELDVRLKILQRRKLISKWDDGMIHSGKPWNEEILTNLKGARIILLLVSTDFLASDYINDHEVPLAMEMHTKKQATVIPIKLRTCDWQPEPYSQLQAPNSGNPVVGEVDTKHARDGAWLEVQNAIKKVAKRLKEKPRGDSLLSA